MIEEETELQFGLSWLLRLRWGAVAGQLMILVIAHSILELELPYLDLLGLVTLTALSNAALLFWNRPAAHTWRLPTILVLDIVLLTVLLAVSGGATNPFSVFFIVHVALAALLLEPKQAWGVSGLTVFAFASLFFLPVTAGHMHHHDHHQWSSHLSGMWIAYVLAAGFIAYFVGQVSRAIRERDRRIAEVAQLAAQNERLATLSSFSANAAHELGTPLATIGIAAKELSLLLQKAAAPSALTSDAELIGREITRCRSILSDLSARAGESVGEMPRRTTPLRVVEELREVLAPPLRPHLHVTYEKGAEHAPLLVPQKTLVQMLHNLIRNAFDAQEEAAIEAPIELNIEAQHRLRFHVLDRGAGLPPHIQERIGEPFVTTKADRGGLGLGLYLARAYAERTGGELVFHPRPGGGSDVELCLALNALGRDS